MSHPDCIPASVRADVRTALSLVSASASVYYQAGRYGCGSYFLSEDPQNQEGGIRVNLWRDLVGNRHAVQRLNLAKQPALVQIGDDWGLRFSGDMMTIAPDWLSGATSFSFVWASRKTVVGGANQRFLTGNAGSNLLVRWVQGTTLQVAIGTVGNYALIADSVLDARVYCVTFDGAGNGNGERLRVWIDGAWRDVVYTGTIPASVPALSNLWLGELGGTEPFQGELFSLAGFVPKLTDGQLEAIAGIAA